MGRGGDEAVMTFFLSSFFSGRMNEVVYTYEKGGNTKLEEKGGKEAAITSSPVRANFAPLGRSLTPVSLRGI